MLLWICFAILTASVVTLLLRPLRHVQSAPVEPAAADLAVYRDQLRELDAERERGLVADGEIDNARAEVARRLLKRAASGDDNAAAPDADTVSRTRAKRLYIAVAGLMPVIAISLYLASGSPNLGAHPFGEQAARDGTSPAIADLIERVETRLRQHPEDGTGWDVIAPVYLRLGRYGDAAHAFAEANRLEGESVRRLLGFAEATLLAGDGLVIEPVRKAALRVQELEPERIEPKVWLALAKEQDGNLAGAAADFRALLEKAEPNSPWRAAVAERLRLVTDRINGEPAPGVSSDRDKTAEPAPQNASPNAPDVAAMSPEERNAFIQSMVDRLAGRLEQNGKDLDGWLRLARAYKVLGRDADAQSALARARENFAGDSAAMAAIDQSEQSLGKEAGETGPR